MVRKYVPDRGDIVWIDLDPTVGREQNGRRPALVLSSRLVNNKSGLALMCPITSSRKGYPFEIPMVGETISGVILTDHVRSIDWTSRYLSFAERIDPDVLKIVQSYIVALVAGED